MLSDRCTLGKLLWSMLHAAEQRDEQQSTVAEGYPPPVFSDDPETIRAVLRMLIESRAALPQPADDEQQPEEEHGRQSNDDDGPALT